jgi:dipeptidyl aminopeptidase/acylaminoacyl peptidase
MEQIIRKLNITDVTKVPNELETYSFFYKSDNLKVRAFIIFPRAILEKNPVVIVNRGGTGEVGIFTHENIKHYNFFSKEGYITIMSQYRGCDGGEGIDRMGGDDVFDIINLYEIISKIPQADIKRIGMWGVSRGGMMAFQVITRIDWIKALIAVSSLIDEVHMSKWRPGWKDHQRETYGGSYAEQYKRSPLLWFKEIPKIPILLFTGMKDDRVDPNKIIEIGKAINATTITFPNDGHFISAKTVNESIIFFNKYI